MSESKRPFKIQVHPIIENIIIEDLNGECTGNEIMDKYAALAAQKYNATEKDVRDSLDRLIPFTPVRSAPDGFVLGVGQNIFPTAMLKDVFANDPDPNHDNKGLFLLSVSRNHPVFNLVQSYDEERQHSAVLEAKVNDLERNVATMAGQVSSNTDKPKKSAKKKKKRSKATTSALVPGNVANDMPAPDNLNIPADDLESADDDALDPPTLLSMLVDLREQMSTERAEMKKELAERKKELEAERAERKKELEAERAARVELEMTVQTEKEHKKKLLEEQQSLRYQIAAEKSERLDQLGEVENRAVELEEWVSTQDPKFLDRIRLRALLDNGQSMLARFIGCSADADVSGASMAWRIKLNGTDGQSRSDEERLQAAHDFLSARGSIPEAIQKLMANHNAMRLLTQKFSIIRKQGNDVAHRLVQSPLLREITARSLNLADREGMLTVLDFVDSYRV